MPTRRTFLAASSLATLAPARFFAQLPQAPTTRPNIIEIDHDRILTAAAVPAVPGDLLAFTQSVPALAAATLVDPASTSRYTANAAAQLKGFFVDPKTRLPATPAYKSFEQLLDFAQLAEVAIAIPFLPLDPDLLAQIKLWFSEYLTYLTEDRTALLARDARTRHGSSWLLQACAAARLTGNDAISDDCRHRFKTVTIRAQINADGLFPHELTTEDPYRNSLFNLDMLAGAANLLSTRFENVWDHELQDGPGLRAAIAKHVVYIRDRPKWPYESDQALFNLLPCRRPALVFAGRAYGAADYVTLWRAITPAQPANPDLLRAFPIRQPVLWIPQPKARA